MSTTVTSQQVLDALQQDKQFGHPMAFPIVSQFAARLPQFVGKERMDETLTMTSLTDVWLKFMDAVLASDTILGNDRTTNTIIRHTYSQVVDRLGGTGLSALLTERGLTEHEALLKESEQFNDDTRALYIAGELTHARLLVINPGVLLPRVY